MQMGMQDIKVAPLHRLHRRGDVHLFEGAGSRAARPATQSPGQTAALPRFLLLRPERERVVHRLHQRRIRPAPRRGEQRHVMPHRHQLGREVVDHHLPRPIPRRRHGPRDGGEASRCGADGRGRVAWGEGSSVTNGRALTQPSKLEAPTRTRGAGRRSRGGPRSSCECPRARSRSRTRRGDKENATLTAKSNDSSNVGGWCRADGCRPSSASRPHRGTGTPSKRPLATAPAAADESGRRFADRLDQTLSRTPDTAASSTPAAGSGTRGTGRRRGG